MEKVYPCLTFTVSLDLKVMKVKAYLSILCIVAAMAAEAGSIDWHEGVLVLKNKEVHVGQLTIQPALNVILLQSDHGSAYYHFDQVDYLTFYDEVNKLSRKFLSVSFGEEIKPNYQLCEVVVAGQISVIRKPISTYVPAVEDVGSYDYFTLENEHIERLTQFRRKVIPSMEASSSKERLKLFMRENGLDPNRNSDAIRLIEYYNDGKVTSTPGPRKHKAFF